MTRSPVPTLSPYLFDQTVLVFSPEAEGSFVSSYTEVETYGPGTPVPSQDDQGTSAKLFDGLVAFESILTRSPASERAP